MNILYICETDPNRATDGREQRTHLLYEALCGIGTVHTLYVEKDPTDFVSGRVDSRFKRMSAIKLAADFAARILQFLIAENGPKICPFPRIIEVERLFPNVKFDFVVMRYLHLAGKIDIWRYGPVYIDVDDHPLQFQETVSEVRRGMFRRWLCRTLVWRSVNHLMRRCAGGWIANPDQIGWFEEPTKIKVLRNIPMEVPATYDPETGRSSALMTVGQMGYKPNWRGVDAFLEAIWPDVRKRYPNLEYWIVGRDAPEECCRRWKAIPGVMYLGFAENIHGLYGRALASVVPVDAGGGTSIKTLESLAHSRVCLSTPFGVRGIAETELADGKRGLWVYRNSEEFLNGLDRVMDVRRRAKIEANARAFAENMFSRKVFADEVRAGLGLRG